MVKIFIFKDEQVFIVVSFGVSLPTYCSDEFGPGPTLDQLREYVETCERLGFTHFWHVDRLMAKALPFYNTSFYEPLITLASIIPFIKKSRIGTSVIVVPYRNPLILAKQLATLDRISNGKLTIGFGRGYFKSELEVCNIGEKDRVPIFNEAVEIIKLLLTENMVTYEGKYWKLKDFSLEPRPIQKPRPPILIAGGGGRIHFAEVNEKLFRRVATLGDGWIAKSDTSIKEMEATIKFLKSYLKSIGKDPNNFMLAHHTWVFVVGKSGTMEEAKRRLKKLSLRPLEELLSSYIIGNPKEVIDRVKAEINAGIQHFIVIPIGFDYELLHFFSDEVMPLFS